MKANAIIIKVVGLFLAGAFVFGMNSPTTDQLSAQAIPVGELRQETEDPKPVVIKILRIKVQASIIEVGLNADKSLEVPKSPREVGWYVHSWRPGGMGPAVLVGHLDSTFGSAVFYNLNKLESGDLIEIQRSDGSVAVFAVSAKEHYSQDNFPTEKVYGNTQFPEIRLITCSGSYNFFKGRYSDNLVVYGTLVQLN